jgi:hypothetical protein
MDDLFSPTWAMDVTGCDSVCKQSWLNTCRALYLDLGKSTAKAL